MIDFNPNLQTSVIQQQAQAASEIFTHFHPDSVVGVKLVSDRSETLAPPEARLRIPFVRLFSNSAGVARNCGPAGRCFRRRRPGWNSESD